MLFVGDNFCGEKRVFIGDSRHFSRFYTTALSEPVPPDSVKEVPCVHSFQVIAEDVVFTVSIGLSPAAAIPRSAGDALATAAETAALPLARLPTET